MAHIALFHSILGLRSVEREAGERLHHAGHEAVVPDLFDGRTAAGIDEGFEVVGQIGWETIVKRGRRAIADMPDETILVGCSMGAGVVCELLSERPSTAGVILLHAFPELPADIASGLRVQLHAAEPDEFARTEQLPALQRSAKEADLDLELFRYPGAGHYYIDRDRPDYDRPAAELTWQRMLDFLDGS